MVNDSISKDPDRVVPIVDEVTLETMSRQVRKHASQESGAIGIPKPTMILATEQDGPIEKMEFSDDSTGWRSGRGATESPQGAMELLAEGSVLDKVAVIEPKVCSIPRGQRIVDAVPQGHFECRKAWCERLCKGHIPDLCHSHIEIGATGRTILLKPGFGDALSQTGNVLRHHVRLSLPRKSAPNVVSLACNPQGFHHLASARSTTLGFCVCSKFFDGIATGVARPSAKRAYASTQHQRRGDA